MQLSKTNTPLNRLAHLIRKKATTAELAKAIDCSLPTARNRINNPEGFTVGELYKISDRLHIPWEEIEQALKQ